jgi:hypothetical protein
MSKEQKDLEIKANEMGKELGDDEIEAASGGDVCVCVIGGDGDLDKRGPTGRDNPCVCFVGGAGTDAENNLRCGCPVGGYGVAR